MAESEGSFIRWQAITIAQLGHANNLILTFATATLGFAVALAKDRQYAPGCLVGCVWALAFLAILASIALGVWCVINRLLDFRKTTGVARDREQWGRQNLDEAEINARLKDRRAETKVLGERTWRIFCWQIGTFGVGVPLLVLAFLVEHHRKLF